MSPSEQMSFYAAQGFWHDALNIAANLHRSNPSNGSWTTLLRSIDLEEMTAEPVLDF